MATLKYHVHSWIEANGTEQITETYGEGETAEEITFDLPTHEQQDFISEEFETLEEAKSNYDSLSIKIRCIFYTCDTHFEGLKTYKHSSFLDNANVTEQAEKDILICSEDNNEEPVPE